ncbi:MAG: hypothetical protein GX892_15550 [Thermoanaerobacteraceae bacterium]|nr:hypothetical protein [Thermoanaerobacteraceae bacterium]
MQNKILPRVPEVPLRDKFEWMTGYFCCDVALALMKLEEMGIDLEKYISELSESWPPNLYKFNTPEEAVMFILNTFGNFCGGKARFLKVDADEAVGEVECVVPYFSEVRPKTRGFVRDASDRDKNIWCEYWCKYWFKNAAAKQGWKYEVEHKDDKCIWKASRLKK